jgi:ferric-dicitrate binding protein FerR (iron transport regulator)
VLAVILFRAPDAVAPAVATVERLEGSALMEAAGDAPVVVRAGTPIPAGVRFVTREGRVALSLGSLSIRVDRGTTLQLGDRELTLQHGAIYVDTGVAGAVPSTLRIVTPEGEVRHVGTQYQVLVQGEKTVVRVREGNVRIDRRDDTHTERVDANEEVVLVRGQSAVRRAVSAHGPEWRWSTEIAPPFDIEGRSLAELLAWLTRENGWQLEYATAAARGAAAEVLLHGGRATAASPETLTRIAAITGFSFSAEDGVLRVSDAR